ncbi:MAG: nuclear transport factor 2 family protein [Rhodothermales bacterium]|nr:nuclear transport factor 2 family protein [Rhodothermales bacterium]
MKGLLPVLVLLASCGPANPADSCLDTESVIGMDAGWEKALLENDEDHLDWLLADDFVWVHNHATHIDTKEGLLQSVASRDETDMKSRVQSDIEVRTLDNTAVVTGYTVVTRESGSTRYRFMRTYVETSQSCLLLANQTMAIHDDRG